MKYNPEKHHRHSIRLKNYDYSQPGLYFVTICIKERECLFGNIENGKVQLSPIGEIAYNIWKEIPEYFNNVDLDEFIIMPNHLHGIIGWSLITPEVEGENIQPGIKDNSKWCLMKNPKQTLGKIIRTYKAKTTKVIRDKGFCYFAWQKNYYDHIIRNENSLNKIREYIINNPVNWTLDIENKINENKGNMNYYNKLYE